MAPPQGIEPCSPVLETGTSPLNASGMDWAAGVEPTFWRPKRHVLPLDDAQAICLVWVAGFEPAAFRFQGGHSTGLSYTQITGIAQPASPLSDAGARSRNAAKHERLIQCATP